jgi:hypothetical protein
MYMELIKLDRQINTAEPLVPGPNSFEAEIAAEELKRKKSPVIDQTVAELIRAGGNTLHSEIHKLIDSI